MEGQLNLFETEEKPQQNTEKRKKQKDASPDQTYDERMKRFWHYWNNKMACENQIETCEGELRIIVEALADYSDYVSKGIELMEHGYGKAVSMVSLGS